MKILVVGHFAVDIIHGKKDEVVRRNGGIFNAVSALSSLLSENDRVIPVFGVGKEEKETLAKECAAMGNVDTAGIFQLDTPTPEVHYVPGRRTAQCSIDIAPPIPYDKMKKFLNVDSVLVNMTSGQDLTVDTLDQLRLDIRPKRTLLLFDYHNLTLGINEKKERIRRPVEFWRRWVFMTDYVQLNEEELQGLAQEKLSEEQGVNHLLTLGTKAIIVTRGAKGASLFTSEHKKTLRTDVDGIAVNGNNDSIGAGDTFGAAFLVHMLKSGDLGESLKFANVVAAEKVASGEVRAPVGIDS